MEVPGNKLYKVFYHQEKYARRIKSNMINYELLSILVSNPIIWHFKLISFVNK